MVSQLVLLSKTATVPDSGSEVCSLKRCEFVRRHKRSKVRAWLDRHQRFTFHFTSTSWLNAV